MKGQVGDEGADQVLPVPGVQQGHVDDADVRPDVLGQRPPLILDFPVAPPKPVDAQDVEQVARPQLSHQPLVLGPVEVLAGLLVCEKVFRRHAHFRQGEPLAVLVLVRAGYADIAVSRSHSMRLPFSLVCQRRSSME